MEERLLINYSNIFPSRTNEISEFCEGLYQLFYVGCVRKRNCKHTQLRHSCQIPGMFGTNILSVLFLSRSLNELRLLIGGISSYLSN